MHSQQIKTSDVHLVRGKVVHAVRRRDGGASRVRLLTLVGEVVSCAVETFIISSALLFLIRIIPPHIAGVKLGDAVFLLVLAVVIVPSFGMDPVRRVVVVRGVLWRVRMRPDSKCSCLQGKKKMRSPFLARKKRKKR